MLQRLSTKLMTERTTRYEIRWEPANMNHDLGKQLDSVSWRADKIQTMKYVAVMRYNTT